MFWFVGHIETRKIQILWALHPHFELSTPLRMGSTCCYWLDHSCWSAVDKLLTLCLFRAFISPWGVSRLLLWLPLRLPTSTLSVAMSHRPKSPGKFSFRSCMGSRPSNALLLGNSWCSEPPNYFNYLEPTLQSSVSSFFTGVNSSSQDACGKLHGVNNCWNQEVCARKFLLFQAHNQNLVYTCNHAHYCNVPWY